VAHDTGGRPSFWQPYDIADGRVQPTRPQPARSPWALGAAKQTNASTNHGSS